MSEQAKDESRTDHQTGESAGSAEFGVVTISGQDAPPGRSEPARWRGLAARGWEHVRSTSFLRRTAILVAVATFAYLTIDLRDTRAELARTERSLSETKREKRDLQDELRETEQALDSERSKTAELQSEVGRLRGDVGDLQGVVAKCETFASTAGEMRSLFAQFLVAWAGFLDAFSNSFYYLASSYVDDMTAVVNQLPSAFQRFDDRYGDCSSAVQGIA